MGYILSFVYVYVFIHQVFDILPETLNILLSNNSSTFIGSDIAMCYFILTTQQGRSHYLSLLYSEKSKT